MWNNSNKRETVPNSGRLFTPLWPRAAFLAPLLAVSMVLISFVGCPATSTDFQTPSPAEANQLHGAKNLSAIPEPGFVEPNLFAATPGESNAAAALSELNITKPKTIETPSAQVKTREPNAAPVVFLQPEAAPNTAEPNIVQVAVAEVNVPVRKIAERNAADINLPKLPVAEANKPEPNVVEPNVPGKAAALAFYKSYAELLQKFVDKNGMVAYRKLNIRRLDLEQFFNQLAKLDRTKYNLWTKEDRMALWINAYNVQMVKNILLNYPIRSSPFVRLWWPPTDIRHIEPIGEIGTKKWDQYKLIVMHEEFNLSTVEDKVLEDFNDPRIFLATMHGTLSGPPLHNEPYYGFKLSKQVDEQARKFLSNPLAFRIDRREKKVYLSAMFDPSWYGPRFIRKYGTDRMFKALPPATRAVLNFIANHVSPADRLFLERETYSISFISHDWRLNDNSDNH